MVGGQRGNLGTHGGRSEREPRDMQRVAREGTHGGWPERGGVRHVEGVEVGHVEGVSERMLTWLYSSKETSSCLSSLSMSR